MLKTGTISPVVRAVLVIGAVAALVTSVTFAALQSEATLTDSTIAGADALQVNNKLAGDETFSPSEDGFQFIGVVPGVASSQTESFALRNTSTTEVDVNVQIPTPPDLTSTGVTGSDIEFTFEVVGGGTVSATWTELTTGDGVLLFSNLAGGATQDFTVKVEIDGGVTPGSVNIPAFDLLFGVPVAAPSAT